MVRVNIVDPKCLTDQHLVAEYLEIMMLMSYIRKYGSLEDIPSNYRLGAGHMKFFKNKVGYLVKRFDCIKKEMKKRGFVARRKLNVSGISRDLMNGWRPTPKDKEVIKRRLKSRIRLKPTFYKYYRKKRTLKFLLGLVDRG